MSDECMFLNCSHCNKIPFITIIPSLKTKVKIDCPCSSIFYVSLSKYINELEIMLKSNTNNNRSKFKPNSELCKCSNVCDYFCKICKIGICSKCIINHNNHLKINIKKYSENINIEEIQEELNKVIKIRSEFNMQIKEKVNFSLKTTIEEIENLYQNNEKTNKNIAKLLNCLIQNYRNLPTNSNFKIIENVKVNRVFNINSVPNLSDKNNIFDLISQTKEYYKTQFLIKNYDLKEIKLKETLTYHKECIFYLLLLQDGRIGSCSKDKSIKVYNMLTNQCEINIENAHTNSVFYLSQLPNGKVLSCSLDGSCKVWNITGSNYELEATLNNHFGGVKKIIPLSNNRIASCSLDEKIAIFNGFPPYNMIKLLEGSNNGILSIIQKRNKELLISLSSSELSFWNIEIYQLLKTIKIGNCRSPIIEIDNERIMIACSFRDCIKIINVKSFQIESNIKEEGMSYTGEWSGYFSFSTFVDGNYLIGTSSCKIVKFDSFLLSCSTLVTKVHQYCPLCIIDLGNRMLCTTSADKTIKIWEY